MAKKETETKIIMLPIEKVHPNINNPRQNVGDISELTDSIKARGILQPLTVVNGEGSYYNDYVIVLGHRRYEAAKAAKLSEIPCIISKMSKAEQIDAMIIENDRREDLTKIERSNGYQMSLELHDDNVSDTAAAVGVSESTVRRYIKLQSIDELTRYKLSKREREGVQITMHDFDKLADFKDEERRKKVANALGTPNFNFTYQRELNDEKAEYRFAALLEMIGVLGIEQTASGDGLRYCSYIDNADALEKKVEELNTEYDGCKLYYVKHNTWIYLYRSYTPEETESLKTEQSESDAVSDERNERRAQLKTLFRAAYNSRYAFMKELTDVKACVVMEYFIKVFVIGEEFAPMANVAALLDIEIPEDIDEDDIYTYFADMVQNKPMLLIAAAVYSALGDNENSDCYKYDLSYYENDYLKNIYEFLCKLGYEMSDTERQLIDGTHELYTKDEE